MKKVFPLIVLVVFAGAFFVRFYNFADRITFGPEQAISLITSAEMVKEKPSLLGIKNVQRVTSTGHRIFSGALFSYTLIPLLLLFDFDPLPITAYFGFLNLFTGLTLFLIAKKVFNGRVAFFSTFFFLFSTQMIAHSTFIWILNYLPLVGILTFYFLYRQKIKENHLNPLLIGLLSGAGFALEYVYLFTAILVLGALLYYSKKKLAVFILFLLGSLIPNLPTVIFDLKHNFYHLWTLWQYLLDTLANPGQAGIAGYHFLHFWPILALVGGYLLTRLHSKGKIATILLVMFFYLFLSFRSPLVDFERPVGMPEELTLENIYKAATVIKKDSPPFDFNVAVLVDFDTRGHILRYPLSYSFELHPIGVEEYPQAKVLYTLSANDYDYETATVWELESLRPFDLAEAGKISESYSVFKLIRR